MSQQYGFGPGSLYGIPSGGSTPFRFGAIQDFSMDIAASTKELFGQYQLPLLVQRGTMKPTGKAKAAQINAAVFNSIFFGQTTANTGVMNTSVDESATIPSSTAYTVQAANHLTFVADLGVTYAATGLPFQLVTTVAAIGQYSVNTSTGTYTFYLGDSGVAIKINYTYTTTTGTILTINNQLLGTTPVFQLVFNQITNGNQTTLTFPCVTSNKFSFATKLEDFTIPEFDVSMFCNAAGQLCTISTTT